MNHTQYLRQYGAQLIDNGYSIVALRPNSKAPLGKDWNHNPLSKETLTRYDPACGIGLLLGVGDNPLCVLDIDSDCKEVTDAFMDYLDFDAQLVRVGQEPRRAVIFRAAQGDWPEVSSNEYVKDGRKIKLEVLKSRKQIAAYGIHPGTGLPYQWLGGRSPLNTKAADLPSITWEEIKAHIKKFNEICETLGGKTTHTALPQDPSPDEWVPDKPKPPCTIEDAERFVFGADYNPDNYQDWLEVGMALHNQFDGSTEALQLWDKWSSRGKETYKGFDDIKARWVSFGHTSGVPVTLGSVVRRYKRLHGLFEDGFAMRAIAARLDRYFGKKILKITGSKDNWFFFDGIHWKKITSEEVAAMVAPKVEKTFNEAAFATKDKDELKAIVKDSKVYKYNPASYVRGLVSTLAILPGNLVNEDKFDLLEDYFGVANGDIDLKTGSFIEPDKDKKISCFTEVAFDKTADCPLWKQTVEQCLVNKETVDYFQKLMGYAMQGNPIEQIIIFLHGKGCNGKSTLMNVLSEVFGKHYAPMRAETIAALGDDRAQAGGPRADLMLLRGARFALASETVEAAKLKSETVKSLTGEVAITARGMRENFVTFKQKAVLFVGTNHLPKIKDVDVATWRRMVLIPFPRNFDLDPEIKRDPYLLQKLLKEKAGILNWLIEGAMKYRKEGLIKPKIIQKGINDWLGESDALGNWSKERLEKKDGAKTKVKDLYADFKVWCKLAEEDYRNSTWFTRTLGDKGYYMKRGKANMNFLFDYALRDDMLEDEW